MGRSAAAGALAVLADAGSMYALSWFIKDGAIGLAIILLKALKLGEALEGGICARAEQRFGRERSVRAETRQPAHLAERTSLGASP